MHLIKWSVRGVDHEAIDKLLEVQETSEGLLLGELVSLAIHDWYSHLPEESEDESPISPTEAVDTPLPQVGQDIAHLKNDATAHSFWSDK